MYLSAEVKYHLINTSSVDMSQEIYPEENRAIVYNLQAGLSYYFYVGVQNYGYQNSMGSRYLVQLTQGWYSLSERPVQTNKQGFQNTPVHVMCWQ